MSYLQSLMPRLPAAARAAGLEQEAFIETPAPAVARPGAPGSRQIEAPGSDTQQTRPQPAPETQFTLEPVSSKAAAPRTELVAPQTLPAAVASVVPAAESSRARGNVMPLAHESERSVEPQAPLAIAAESVSVQPMRSRRHAARPAPVQKQGSDMADDDTGLATRASSEAAEGDDRATPGPQREAAIALHIGSIALTVKAPATPMRPPVEARVAEPAAAPQPPRREKAGLRFSASRHYLRWI